MLDKLKDYINYFPVPEFCILFNEKLLDYAKYGIKPLQYVSLEVLSLLILHNYDIEEADSIVETIINKFAYSSSSYMINLYIDFFEICCNKPYTIRYIEEKLLDPFITTSKSKYKSVKIKCLKTIPKLKYLLTDSDILEEIQSILVRYSEDKTHELTLETEEVNFLLFKWKKEAKTAEGKVEEKLFEEERRTREQIRREIVKKNERLVEERKKRDEEEEQKGGLKVRLGTLNDKGGDGKRGHSSNKAKKSKTKTTKGKSKVSTSKTSLKSSKKSRRNTTHPIPKSPHSANLHVITREEHKDGSKRNSLLITDSSRNISADLKPETKKIRKGSDPFSYHK